MSSTAFEFRNGLYQPTDTEISMETPVQPYRWASDLTLETDPHGIPPVPAAEADDAELWPAVADRKGKNVRSQRPDPAAVDTAIRRAQQMQGFDLSVLAKTPGHDEIATMTAQGARHRADWRELADREHQHALAQADAQIQHEAQVAERTRRYDNEVADAAERQRTATDPTRALVRLAWAEKWLPLAGLVPAVFAVCAGAVNVFSELGRINPETQWVNWAVEPLFTLPLLVILAAQMLGALPKPDLSAGLKAAFRTNRYVGMELGLTGMAIVLNVVLHWLPANHWSGDLVWMVVPAGLGFSAYLVPRLVTDIRQALTEWSASAQSRAAEGVTPLSYSDNTVLDQAGGNPSREDEVTAEVALMLRSGEWAVPVSAKTIRDRFECGTDIARTVRDRVNPVNSKAAI